jgi:ABC-type transport system involved in cytochrome c biogenesis permease subunit
MNGWTRYLVPAAVVALAVAFLGAALLSPEDPRDGFHLAEFGRLPVVDAGRTKPMDTYARNSLMQISERQSFTDEHKNTQPAIKWLLDVMSSQLARQGVAEKEEVFRITNDQLLSMLKLEEKPGSYRYSVNEFADKISLIAQRAGAAQKKDASDRDLVDAQLVQLAEHLQIYVNVANLEGPYAVPPQSKGDDWKPLIQALGEEKQGGPENPAARALGMMLLAYAQDKPADFNREVENYRHRLDVQMPETLARTDFEVFYNSFAPFFRCWFLYPVVALLGCLSWLGFRQPLRNAALALLVVTLVVHGFGLFGRMYLMDRPLVFVTNLYSSAVFIGWVGGILCVALELVFRNSIGNVVGAVIGFTTAVIAHYLAAGDTLEMMRAVLDTNFWLATHVTCVTSGYAATFVAGLLGITLIFYALGCHLAGKRMDRDVFQSLGWMIYGVACFATLLSFTGTVLGGIWADQSWGRFWGWDPKENGALLIVIWNALILHARWAGMVKQRGTAVLAVAGNIVTSWSWFGVNMLGVGLHSYGFMAAAVPTMLFFILSQLAIIVIALLPLPVWQQLTPVKKQEAVPEPTPPRIRTDSPFVTAAP